MSSSRMKVSTQKSFSISFFGHCCENFHLKLSGFKKVSSLRNLSRSGDVGDVFIARARSSDPCPASTS